VVNASTDYGRYSRHASPTTWQAVLA